MMSTKSMRPPPRRTACSPNSKKRKEGLEMGKRAYSARGMDAKEKEKEKGGVVGLAGYLAHEFLTKGTVMGRRWEEKKEKEKEKEDKYETYVKLAALLKTDGAHLAGVVNPTQLAQHLQII